MACSQSEASLCHPTTHDLVRTDPGQYNNLNLQFINPKSYSPNAELSSLKLYNKNGGRTTTLHLFFKKPLLVLHTITHDLVGTDPGQYNDHHPSH